MQRIKKSGPKLKKRRSNNKLNNVDISNNTNQTQGIKVQLSNENILVDQNLDNSNVLLAGYLIQI